jgi:hypothetical protein
MSYFSSRHTDNCPVCKYKDASIESDITNFRLLVRCKACGMFIISDLLVRTKELSENPFYYIAGGLIREANENSQPTVELQSNNIDEYFAEAREPHTLSEKLDRILLYISKKTNTVSEFIELYPYDFAIAFAKNPDEFKKMLYFLKERKLINMPHPNTEGIWNSPIGVELTLNGWEKADELRKINRVSGKQCFVAMSFDEGLKFAYLNGIEPAIRKAGYNPKRIDFVEHNEYIPYKIIAEIRQSRIMVADFTGQKSGVYFEAGFAMGLNIPVIWTCMADEIDQCHFDTKQFSHIVWQKPEDLKEKLENRIRALYPLK